MRGIEWTDATWNPVTGCTKISQGCKNCYAERMAFRLQKMGQANYRNGFDVTVQPTMLDRPLHWKKPRMVFVNSMSDLFHSKVPDDFIEEVFDVMRRASRHRFQVLTKRAARMEKLGVSWRDYKGGGPEKIVKIAISEQNQQVTRWATWATPPTCSHSTPKNPLKGTPLF